MVPLFMSGADCCKHRCFPKQLLGAHGMISQPSHGSDQDPDQVRPGLLVPDSSDGRAAGAEPAGDLFQTAAAMLRASATTIAATVLACLGLPPHSLGRGVAEGAQHQRSQALQWPDRTVKEWGPLSYTAFVVRIVRMECVVEVHSYQYGRDSFIMCRLGGLQGRSGWLAH